MYKLLRFREDIITIFKRYEYVFVFLIKFILGAFISFKVSQVHLYQDALAPLLKPPFPFVFNMFFGLFFAVMPLPLSYFLLTLLMTLMISKSMEIAIIVFVFFALVLIFYGIVASKESIFILLTILGFYFKMPLVVFIVAGLYFNLTTIIGICIGIFIWRSVPIVLSFAQEKGTTVSGITDLLALPQNSFDMVNTFFLKMGTEQGWVFECMIFSMVVILVYFVSKFSFDFSKEIAIILGGLLTIVGFLIVYAIVGYPISFVSVFLGTMVCVILALLFRSFDCVLNYQSAQRLEFQDEDNYYYVRVIPKIKSKEYLLSNDKGKFKGKSAERIPSKKKSDAIS